MPATRPEVGRGVFAALGLGLALAVACAPARPRASAEPVREPELVAAIEPPAQAGPWPEDCPPLAGASLLEIARISADVGDSPRGSVYIVARGELQATYAAWRDAARARGFRVLAEHASEQVRAASLIDPAGARAHIPLQRSDGDELAGMFGRGRREPTPLRGPCVAVSPRSRAFDVERGAIGYDGSYHRERRLVVYEARFGHDFDADGELDLLVPTAEPAACPRDLTWTVYLGRGGCFHAVGEVGPGDLEHDGVVATGPRPLRFWSQASELGDGGVISTTVHSTYTFDGAGYVRSARDQERGVCHHCSVEICRPPPS